MGESKNYIVYDDDFPGYSVTNFCLSNHHDEVLESVMIPSGLIRDRIEKVAADVTNDMIAADVRCISTLCILKGGFRFFADLLDSMERVNRTRGYSVPVSVDFIRISSYVNDQSTNNIRIIGLDNLEGFRGKDVLIVEDIIDTGKTMSRLVAHLQQFEPHSIRVASLLVKRTPLSCGYRPDFTGFEIPDRFIVGYALDYNDHFRDLSHICVINDEGRRRYAKPL